MKRTISAIALAGALTLTGCAGTTPADEGPAPSTSTSTTQEETHSEAGEVGLPAPESVAERGETAQVGAFEFEVLDVQTGLDEMPPNNYGEDAPAEGSYTVVEVEARNVGTAPSSLAEHAETHLLLTDDGYQYRPALLAVSGFESFNPGEATQGKIIFDVPAGKTGEALLIHDEFGFQEFRLD